MAGKPGARPHEHSNSWSSQTFQTASWNDLQTAFRIPLDGNARVRAEAQPSTVPTTARSVLGREALWQLSRWPSPPVLTLVEKKWTPSGRDCGEKLDDGGTGRSANNELKRHRADAVDDSSTAGGGKA
eukprot:scaffold7116_cov296-Pinguiococcus_pyrenoidosus.AAC.12